MTAAAGHAVLALAIWGSAAFALGVARRLGSARLAPTVWLVVLGLGCWTSTEVFSIGGWLGWTASAMSALALATLGLTPIAREARWKDLARALRVAVRADVSVAAALAVILGATLLLALVAPPNTWDAMVYHNPRLLHWLAQGSVAHYETSIDRQLRMPPLASYLRLHLFALSGSDWLFNSVQWTFFAACIAQAGVLGLALTCRPAVAWLAAAFTATAPLAILEASSSQNDLVAAGYVMAAAVAALEARRAHVRPQLVLLACAAVGLGAAAKGTIWPIGPLLLVATAVARRQADAGADASDDRRAPMVTAWAWVGGLALVSLLIAPQLLRNRRHFGEALPHPETVALTAWSDHGPARLISQLWRGALLELQPLFTRDVSAVPLLAANEAVHRVLGVAPADPAITWTADVPFLGSTSPLHEDTAGNPVHFGLAVLATLAAVAHPRIRRDRTLIGLLALAWSMWAAVVIPFRWMPWGARLQLPALLLFAVPVACVVGGRGDRAADRRATAVALGLAVFSIPWLAFNASRPLISRAGAPSILERSRWENLFRNRPELRPDVERVVQLLPATCSGERPVGLAIGGHQWEYALWAGAWRDGRRIDFRHVPRASPVGPWCAVVSDRCAGTLLCLRPPP